MLTQRQALRRFRLAVSFFFFVQGVVFASWANRIPDIKETLGLDDRQLGTVLFAIPMGQMAAMALSGWLVNKFGSRRMMTIGALLYSLLLIPLGLAPSAHALMGCLFLFGVSSNLCNAAVNTQAIGAERLHGKTIMASFHGLWSMGGFLGGLISMAFVGAHMSPEVQFACVTAAAAMTICYFRAHLVRFDVKAQPKDVEEQRGGRLALLRKIDPFVVALGCMAFAAMVCEGCMYDWSGVYYREVVGVEDGLVQLGYVVCLCTMTIGRFVSDHFVMRYGRRAVIITSGLLIFGGMMLAVILPNIACATIGLFFVGFGISSTVPICYSLAGHSGRMSSAMAVTTVASIGYMGFLLGPPVIGHISHAISLHYTFGIMACVGLLLALGAMRLKLGKADKR